MLECNEVKEYLDSIGLPYDEKESGGMKVLQMQYNQDLCAIFPPVDDCPKYSVILAYNGAVQSGTTMTFISSMSRSSNSGKKRTSA